MRGVSGDDPEDGARSGVPPQTARNRRHREAPGPRPPGTTTWLRGARCTDPEQMPEKEARDRSPKSPRWSAERRASPERRKAPRQASGVPRYDTPAGTRAPERYLGAPPPLIRVREAKKTKPGRKTRRGNEETCAV